MTADILALDLATRAGWCRGRVGETPIAGSIRFGQRDASDNAVFGHCLSWLSRELEPQPRPDLLILEAMLPPGAKLGYTNTNVRDRLAGLHGVVRAVAFLRGIYQIAEYSVGDVRAHFIGDRSLKRHEAKARTVQTCRLLGWQVADDNAGDACALWSFAASIIDPDQALKLSPLFNKQLRAAG